MGWIVLLPPVIAIVLALWTRQVFLSLLTGLWLGTTLLEGGNPVLGLRGLADQMVAVFSDAGNTRVVFFCLLVGGLIALVQASGGVSGFITFAQNRGWGTTRRGAELLAVVTGLVVFVESSITSLIVGAVGRPFFDRLNLPREKLAYYCDATSAPVCMMIPLNGWGAYLLGLLAAQGLTDGAVGLLAESLLYNFYSFLAVAFAVFLAVSGRGWGLMKQAEDRAAATGQLTRPGSVPMIADEVVAIQPVSTAPRQARDFFIPLAVMILGIFGGLWITGSGNMMQGSGSTAVLWAVGLGILVAMLLYAVPRKVAGAGRQPVMSIPMSMDMVLKGCMGLVPVTLLIVLAFALGQVSRELEMGPYLVSVIAVTGGNWWMPALVFLVACFVSFTLGSSWTTFAIVLPVALPLAEGLGLPAALMLGAVLSGGVFGDHASPLSDTSIISSMASACDHVDHVTTQMPYAIGMAAVSTVLFLIAGLLA
ncbi:MAG TPA: Na+/H+ antiporter NhaC family protein [Rhodothermia bacterium]